MNNYSLLWTWKYHENMSLVLAKIIPAASQSQPSPTRTRQRECLKEREILLLILCSTATGNFRPWTRFHCVSYYSPVLLLLNPSSAFSLLMFPTIHSKQPTRRSSSASYNLLDQKRAGGGWRKQWRCQGRKRLQKGQQGNPYTPSKHREQKPASTVYSTAPWDWWRGLESIYVLRASHIPGLTLVLPERQWPFKYWVEKGQFIERCLS